jgi:hypothetical protein
MARPGLTIHPKFRRLVHVLQEPVPHVVGYLECLWMVGYENGEALVGDALDVELAAQYPGERGNLFRALLDCRWIDDLGNGKYAIHDLFDHAPEYVQGRARKEAERRKEKTCANCGIIYHSTEAHSKYCSHPCRQAGYRSRTGDDVTQRDAALRHNDAGVTEGPVTVTESDGPPAPAPAPAPAPDIEASPNGEVSAEPTSGPAVTADEFMEAWNGVPQFTHCRKMTDARLKYFRARAADPSWVSSWKEALDRAAASPFCRGENERGWRADVDWFLRPDTVTKVLEGRYDRTGNGKATAGKPTATDFFSRIKET